MRWWLVLVLLVPGTTAYPLDIQLSPAVDNGDGSWTMWTVATNQGSSNETLHIWQGARWSNSMSQRIGLESTLASRSDARFIAETPIGPYQTVHVPIVFTRDSHSAITGSAVVASHSLDEPGVRHTVRGDANADPMTPERATAYLVGDDLPSFDDRDCATESCWSGHWTTAAPSEPSTASSYDLHSMHTWRFLGSSPNDEVVLLRDAPIAASLEFDLPGDTLQDRSVHLWLERPDMQGTLTIMAEAHGVLEAGENTIRLEFAWPTNYERHLDKYDVLVQLESSPVDHASAAVQAPLLSSESHLHWPAASPFAAVDPAMTDGGLMILDPAAWTLKHDGNATLSLPIANLGSSEVTVAIETRHPNGLAATTPQTTVLKPLAVTDVPVELEWDPGRPEHTYLGEIRITATPLDGVGPAVHSTWTLSLGERPAGTVLQAPAAPIALLAAALLVTTRSFRR